MHLLLSGSGRVGIRLSTCLVACEQLIRLCGLLVEILRVGQELDRVDLVFSVQEHARNLACELTVSLHNYLVDVVADFLATLFGSQAVQASDIDLRCLLLLLHQELLLLGRNLLARHLSASHGILLGDSLCLHLRRHGLVVLDVATLVGDSTRRSILALVAVLLLALGGATLALVALAGHLALALSLALVAATILLLARDELGAAK